MFYAKQKYPRKQNFKQKGPREAQQKNIKFPAAKVPPYITCKKKCSIVFIPSCYIQIFTTELIENKQVICLAIVWSNYK